MQESHRSDRGPGIQQHLHSNSIPAITISHSPSVVNVLNGHPLAAASIIGVARWILAEGSCSLRIKLVASGSLLIARLSIDREAALISAASQTQQQ